MGARDDNGAIKGRRLGLRRVAADVFCAAGGLHVGRWMTRRVPRILLYHRFGSDDEGRRTCADIFAQQVIFLKRHCHVMAMAELGERLRAGESLPDNTVVITVDDGYEDFYTHAFPVLSRYGLPATFYVTTGFVDRTSWLWPDTVSYMLENTPLRQWPLMMRGEERLCSPLDKRERRKLWIEICQYCLSLEEQQKHLFLADLAQRLEVNVPAEIPSDCAPVSCQQLREMSRSGIEIGAHTVTHPRLIKIPEGQLVEEIVGAKRRIEEIIGQPVLSFSYPNGGTDDYDERLKDLVEKAGYLSAAVAFPETGTWDRFEIGRSSVGPDMRAFQFLLSCRGVFSRPNRRADATPRWRYEF